MRGKCGNGMHMGSTGLGLMGWIIRLHEHGNRARIIHVDNVLGLDIFLGISWCAVGVVFFKIGVDSVVGLVVFQDRQCLRGGGLSCS